MSAGIDVPLIRHAIILQPVGKNTRRVVHKIAVAGVNPDARFLVGRDLREPKRRRVKIAAERCQGMAADGAQLRPVITLDAATEPKAFVVTWLRRIDYADRSLNCGMEVAPSPGGPWVSAGGTLVSGPAATGDGLTERLTQLIAVPGSGSRYYIRQRVTQE